MAGRNRQIASSAVVGRVLANVAQALPASAVKEYDFIRVPGEANSLLDRKVHLSRNRRLQEVIACAKRNDLLDAVVFDAVDARFGGCAAFKEEIFRTDPEGEALTLSRRAERRPEW